MLLFETVAPGFYSSFQDVGRLGACASGYAVSGALDRHAYCWGNRILGNPYGSISIEITLGQCILQALNTAYIAVTGADLTFSINDKPMPLWQLLQVNAGDVLKWGRRVSGMRAYLSVQGGFSAAKYLGSASVNLREGIGHLLEKGQQLHAAEAVSQAPHWMPQCYQPDYDAAACLSCVLFPEAPFSDESKRYFMHHTFTISAQNDRTAYQFEAHEQVKPLSSNVVSRANLPGMIQVNLEGGLIVMMQDAPSMGGYPVIGRICSTSLSALAQRTTRQSISFEGISTCDAQQKVRLFDDFFQELPIKQ